MKQVTTGLNSSEILAEIKEIEYRDTVIIRLRLDADIAILDTILKMDYDCNILLHQDQKTTLSMASETKKWKFFQDRTVDFRAGKRWDTDEFIEGIAPSIDFVQVVKSSVNEELNRLHNYEMYITQYGGLVCGNIGKYIFAVEPNIPGYRVGEAMPSDWKKYCVNIIVSGRRFPETRSKN